MRPAIPRNHWPALALGCAASLAACTERDEVVGTITAPDVAFLYDGGTPPCPADEALEAAQLSVSWLTVSKQCEMPASWLSAAPRLLDQTDAGVEDPPDPLAPDATPQALSPGWNPDRSVLLYLLWGHLLLPGFGEAPTCANPSLWYVDFAADPNQVILCPELCHETRAYIGRAIDEGCRRLAP